MREARQQRPTPMDFVKSNKIGLKMLQKFTVVYLKCLLIVPRFSLNTKPSYNYTWPLGLSYISSAIKKAGFSLDVLNINHESGAVDEIINRKLDSVNFDYVLTGDIGIGFGRIKEIVRIVRQHFTKPQIILGGAILSEPELIFEALRPDYAIIGEGDIAIVTLLKELESGNQPTNKIIYGETPQNLDELPYPDLEGLGFAEYLENQNVNHWYYNNSYDFPKVYPLLASRSCPFHCTFCDHYGGGKYRERNIEKVLEEVRWAIDKFDINILCIYDDLFSIKLEKLYKFCNGIEEINKNRQFPIKWTCQLSVHNISHELLKKMKEAGCEVISYGFESYSPKVLKSMRKPITPELIDKAIKMTMEEKIGIQGNFIFGDIAETKEIANETLSYWKKECRGQVNLAFIQPYPNSEIYQSCVKRGIIKDKIAFIENDMNSSVPINMTESMTDEEFRKLDEDIQDAQMQYGYFVVPNSVKKGEKEYEVEVTCPFCKKQTQYKNYWLQNRLFYSSLITCRKCNMRFNVLSTLFNFSRIGNIFPKLVRLYRKLRRLAWKR